MSLFDDFDFCDCDYCAPKRNKEMSNKNFMISSGHTFDTEDQALDAAKKRVAKYQDDVLIYKATKQVSTTTPNVEVKDISV